MNISVMNRYCRSDVVRSEIERERECSGNPRGLTEHLVAEPLAPAQVAPSVGVTERPQARLSPAPCSIGRHACPYEVISTSASLSLPPFCTGHRSQGGGMLHALLCRCRCAAALPDPQSRQCCTCSPLFTNTVWLSTRPEWFQRMQLLVANFHRPARRCFCHSQCSFGVASGCRRGHPSSKAACKHTNTVPGSLTTIFRVFWGPANLTETKWKIRRPETRTHANFGHHLST
ncbi:hypothetical protein LZ30DRAFT_38931 [Colletotrichum cereale]|nr:hypothetical protein LZ30DRAFT_38931 [Colletotrichum cereale]